MPKQAGAGRKKRLTRERVIRAAIAHADARGIEGLNMRVLARRLKCGVMSIYNHVASKDDLIDGMVEGIAGEIALPSPDQGWREALTGIEVSVQKTLLRHPWAAVLWWRHGAGPTKLAHLESILRVMREAGFSVELACRGYHALTMHTIGFALQAVDLPANAKAMEAAGRQFLSSIEPDRIPYFAEHIRHHIEHPEPGNEFRVVLDMILDGLDKSLREQAKESNS